MKMTVLEMTQNVLSSLSSDEVNSVSDSQESMQVATILQTCFFNMMSRAALPEQKKLIQLEPSLDPALPILMTKPDNATKIEWMKYFNSNPNATLDDSVQHDINVDIVDTDTNSGSTIPGYQYVTILGITQFMDMVNTFNPDDSNVVSYEFVEAGRTYTLYYKDDRQPCYCATLENNVFLFDSYDATQDTTLQGSKTMCYGQVVPTFELTDNFIPEMEDYKFPLLLNEAKSLAYFELKQAMHPKAEQEVKRQWSNVSKTKSLTDKPTYFDQLPNFGRRPGTGGYALTVRSY